MDRHFLRSNSNSASFNLAEIWNLPINSAVEESEGGLDLRTPNFVKNTNQIGEVSTADSASFEQITVNGGYRKRNGGEDESSKAMSCSNGKRIKKDGSKEEKNEPGEKGYIHVRARRGQATDSHSLAERARREKISERMKILQDIVPGCNKVIGKAIVLDEIINYIQSLQHQVQFLSMKLEATTSKMLSDNTIEGFRSKDLYGEQGYDGVVSTYPSQVSKEYECGSSLEWLTGNLDRNQRVKMVNFTSTTNKTM